MFYYYLEFFRPVTEVFLTARNYPNLESTLSKQYYDTIARTNTDQFL